MNENMQKIENEIHRLEILRHADPTLLNEEDKKICNYLISYMDYNTFYSPSGRKISMSVGSIARTLQDPHVAETEIENFWVSTVWTGMDMAMSRFFSEKADTKPIIFETMIFGNSEKPDENCELNNYQQRYSTIEEAEIGHQAAVELLKSYLAIEKK